MSPRRFQFGLRKLLLWTAALALYLGVLRMVAVDRTDFVVLMLWVTIVVALRVLAGPVHAAMASLLGCGLGFFIFALVEITFRAVDWADNLMGAESEGSPKPLSDMDNQRKYGYAVGALLVALLGSIGPVAALVDLWQQPIGSGIRPMGAPFAVLLYGCGTPIVVGIFAANVFTQTSSPNESVRRKLLLRCLAVLGCVIGLMPLFLTTVGMYWVIKARNLWIKP